MSQQKQRIISFSLQCAGRERRLPRKDLCVRPNELESVMARLHQMMKMMARLARRVESIRLRALQEQGGK